jgi:hypothetical protein
MTNYIVSSYGRADKIRTFETIPASCLSQIELWVRPEEKKMYSKQWYASKVKALKTWEPEIDCIAKKRKWLGNEYGKNFTLIDDDLSMYVWHPKLSKYVPAMTQERRFEREFLERFPVLFDKHHSVSLPMKLFSDQKARELLDSKGDLVSHNQLGYVFSGYRKKALHDLNHKVYVFTDLSLSIQQFQRSKSSVVYYGMCFQQSSAKALATSGMGSYRSDFIKVDAALKMMKIYPGIITGFKTNKETNGGGISIIKRMQRLINGVTDKHKDETMTNLDDLLVEHGLRKVPKRFEVEYDVPRADIEAQIKTNWKAAK